MKALVILSGGQDSVTCLFWALKKYSEVEAITFTYGQRHSVEVECSKEICMMYNVPQKIIDLSFISTLSNSALVVQGKSVSELNSKGLPDSFVPNRNLMFFSVAHAWAQQVNADVLVSGVCETDYSGYPDCRDKFIKYFIDTANIGSDSNIQFETPLMYLNKAQTFKLAHELEHLKEVVEMSHSCYEGDRSMYHVYGYGCGKCPACQLRKKGFEEFSSEYLRIL